MCDYSLQNVLSRPAKVGDKLVTTKFSGFITRGFAAIGEPMEAVCLLPGTEVAFVEEAEYEHFLGYLIPRLCKIKERLARFRQVNVNKPNVHHDALEFPNGKIVLVTHLREGQYATVLQLPASSRVASATEERERDRLVA